MFFHLLGAFSLVAGTVVAGVAFETARRREAPAEIALLLGLSRFGLLLVALGTLLVLGFGLWLVGLGDWGYGAGWVDAAIGLFVVAVVLGGIGGQRPKRARKLAQRLASEGAPASAELRALLDDRAALAVNYLSALLLLGVLLLMVFKPGAATLLRSVRARAAPIAGSSPRLRRSGDRGAAHRRGRRLVVLGIASGVDEGERRRPGSASQLRQARAFAAKLVEIAAAEFREAARLVSEPRVSARCSVPAPSASRRASPAASTRRVARGDRRGRGSRRPAMPARRRASGGCPLLFQSRTAGLSRSRRWRPAIGGPSSADCRSESSLLRDRSDGSTSPLPTPSG